MLSTIQPFWQPVIIFLLPFLAFLAGAYGVNILCGVKLNLVALLKQNPKPLYARFCGYDKDSALLYWKSIRGKGQIAELNCFLLSDLALPLVYGSAFGFSIWTFWSSLDEPLSLYWLFLPLLVTMVADWTENTIQLLQLRRFVNSGKDKVQSMSIRIASLATTLKLALFVVTAIVHSALFIATLRFL